MTRQDAFEAPILAIAELHLWDTLPDRDAIARHFIFADFCQAFAFLTQVALLAEKHDHHPEIHNLYNKVTLILSTHDQGGVTEKDLALAREIDGICPP